MNEQNWKKSGQIPAFGDWEYANELPITQYFECARQAVVGGLLRYSNSSSGECHLYDGGGGGGGGVGGGGGGGGGHHHAIDFKKPPVRATSFPPPPQKTRVSSNKRCPQKQVNDQKRQVKKVRDVSEPPRKQLSSQKLHLRQHSTATIAAAKSSNFANHNRRQPTTAAAASAAVVKAVDEDLYKIPAELLHKTKRKKKLGIFSRCLVPTCMV